MILKNDAQEKLRGEDGADASQEEMQALSDALTKKDALEEKAQVALYDGTQTPDDTKVESTNDFNKEKANAGYAEDSNDIIVNIDKTDMTNSTEVVRSLLHEQERHTQSQNGDTQTLDATSQTTLATNRGERAATVWDDYSDLAGISTTNTNSATTQASWNSANRNSKSVSAGTKKVKKMDSEDVKPSIYIYKNKVVATDGVNDHKVIDLTFEESFAFREKDRVSALPGEVQVIEQEDTSKYENVLNLENSEDFETLKEGTDMNYDNIDKDTKIVIVTGMNNDDKAAENIQKNIIGQDFDNVGLINNQTDETFGVLGDVFEWIPDSLTTKDVLNAEMLQRLSPDTLVITHSAGNPDIDKANQVNDLVGAQTPYVHKSVASPISASDLKSSDETVGATFLNQINNPHDPVANGLINKNANYEVDYDPINNLINGTVPIPIIEDLLEEHTFSNYYEHGLKEEIQKIITND